MEKKFGSLESTEMQINWKRAKIKGRIPNNRSKHLISHGQQDQREQKRRSGKRTAEMGTARQRGEALPGGVSSRSRAGKEGVCNQTDVLMCWQPAPAPCQAQAGVTDSLCSAC